MNFRLLVREKAKIHRSHKRVFNGLVVDIHTMWFNSIVPPLHGFCVCMDVSMTSNLKFTVHRVFSNLARKWATKNLHLNLGNTLVWNCTVFGSLGSVSHHKKKKKFFQCTCVWNKDIPRHSLTSGDPLPRGGWHSCLILSSLAASSIAVYLLALLELRHDVLKRLMFVVVWGAYICCFCFSWCGLSLVLPNPY